MNEPAFSLPPESSPRPRPATTAAVTLLRTLAHHGVRAAFGIPGGTASPLFDGLVDVPEIQFISSRHEAMAGFEAAGFARGTGMPAIVMTTSGPGLTNAVTGMAAAALEELPVIFLAGDVASSAVSRGALQDGSPAGLDALSMVRSMTRWAATLQSPEAACSTGERAWQLATGEHPGPVFIAVPLDIGGRPGTAPAHLASSSRVVAAPNALACQKAAKLLRGAKHPLLLLGNGARSAAREALTLAIGLSVPVAVTGHAKGVFPETHPLYLGVVGVGQHPSVTEYLGEPPDVLCVVGSRLGDVATNGWRLPIAGTAETIQIDRDPLLLGRNVPLTLGIVGDARQALREMLRALPLGPLAKPRWTKGCRSTRQELARAETVPLKPQRVLAGLSEAFPQAVWCSDIGEHLSMALHYLRIEDPSSFHAMVGFGSMGSGIGSAIGMKVGRPDATVIGLCGDGGLAMFAGEIMTCVENEIGVIFAVFNDGRWNMIEHGFRTVYGRLPPALPSRIADLAEVARGFGAIGVTIRHPEDLDPKKLRKFASSTRPVVLDIRVDPSESFTGESRAAAIRHFAECT